VHKVKEGLTRKLTPLNFSNVCRKKALYGAEKALIGAPYTYNLLDVQIDHVQRVGLDEVAARLDLVTHQDGEDLVRFDGVLDLDLQQDPVFRVHGGLPELLRVHLAQAFVALDAESLLGVLQEEGQQIFVVAGLQQDLAGFLLHGCPAVGHGLHDAAVVVHQHFVLVGGQHAQDLMVDDGADVTRVKDDPLCFQLVLASRCQRLHGLEIRLQLGEFLQSGRHVAADDHREQFGGDALLDHLVEDGAVVDELADNRDDLFAAVDPVALLQTQNHVFSTFFQQEVLHGRLVAQVHLLLAALDLVERRLGDVEVPALDQFVHVVVEEGQEQGQDVGSVHVGIGHDDDPAVAQLGDVEIILADAGP